MENNKWKMVRSLPRLCQNPESVIVKADLTAEDAECFAEGAEKDCSFAYLCDYLGVLCV